MNNEAKEKFEDEIELIDIWRFILRQRLFIAIVLLIITTTALTYALTRPTIWQSNTSLVIGEKFYFFQQQQQQIESSDEIKYRYSKNAVILPVKNTRIIEITTTANSKDLSIEEINQTKTEIVANHKQLFEDKKTEFVRLLNAISKENTNRTELVKLLDNASNSNLTRQLSEVSTVEKPYSGMFMKIVGIGIFVGLALAFLLAGIKDYFEQKNQQTQQKL